MVSIYWNHAVFVLTSSSGVIAAWVRDVSVEWDTHKLKVLKLSGIFAKECSEAGRGVLEIDIGENIE